MSVKLDAFVQAISAQIDGTKTEKAEIHEEIRDHLELSVEHWVQEGYNRKEAEQLAIDQFGASKKIGTEIQEAMFPYRKLLLLVLAISSVCYSVLFYVTQLFVEGDALIVWLVISMASSSILFLFAYQAFPAMDRKRWLNSTLIIHVFVYLLGFSGVQSNQFISVIFSFVALFIVLLGIVLVYRTTIVDFSYQQNDKKQVKYLHVYNITIGIALTGITLFFLWAFLAFSEGWLIGYMFIFIPLVCWIAAYIVQIQLGKRNKVKSAYIVAALPLLLVVSIVIIFYIPRFSF
ncbi:permease prefix domain 1-containing protein [Virgibacillus sp. W0181]|uniref:permease prefix domain 1-containing protein n=1 Tax=Virgibacillus sp. W0181 TaxID=3391581 RepID=UPI003F487455